MNIKEIPFAGIRFTKDIKDAVNLKISASRTWSGPIALPEAVRIFGQLCSHFNFSAWGGIRFAEASGRYHWWAQDSTLPQGLDETKKGWLLAPWGELQRLATCGTTFELFQVNSIIVIDFNVKDNMLSRHYQYQVQFDLRKPNIVQFHYYACKSKWNTFVGAVAEPDNYINWDIKENQLYARKALEIDTTPITGEIINTDGDNSNSPFGNIPTVTPTTNLPIPPTSSGSMPNTDPVETPSLYRTVFEGSGYRVQELKK